MPRARSGVTLDTLRMAFDTLRAHRLRSALTVSLREGRFVAETDDEHRRPVLVIGHNVAQALFGALGSASGREVRFAGRPFTVIGVLEKRKGGFMGENEDDNAVFMPYRTGRIVAPRASDWLMLVIRARPPVAPSVAAVADPAVGGGRRPHRLDRGGAGVRRLAGPPRRRARPGRGPALRVGRGHARRYGSRPLRSVCEKSSPL